MKNKVYSATKSDLPALREYLASTPGLWVGELDGNQIHDWADYAKAIEVLMQFPTICTFVDVYLDWIRDLSWLNADGYALIIKNYSNFMDEDPELKKHVMHLFFKNVLPWWEEDVKRFVVEGEPKPFNLYLID